MESVENVWSSNIAEFELCHISNVYVYKITVSETKMSHNWDNNRIKTTVTKTKTTKKYFKTLTAVKTENITKITLSKHVVHDMTITLHQDYQRASQNDDP